MFTKQQYIKEKSSENIKTTGMVKIQWRRIR